MMSIERKISNLIGASEGLTEAVDELKESRAGMRIG